MFVSWHVHRKQRATLVAIINMLINNDYIRHADIMAAQTWCAIEESFVSNR